MIFHFAGTTPLEKPADIRFFSWTPPTTKDNDPPPISVDGEAPGPLAVPAEPSFGSSQIKPA
jgi:hypothetical protein